MKMSLGRDFFAIEASCLIFFTEVHVYGFNHVTRIRPFVYSRISMVVTMINLKFQFLS